MQGVFAVIENEMINNDLQFLLIDIEKQCKHIRGRVRGNTLLMN